MCGSAGEDWSYTYYYTAPAQSTLLPVTGMPFTVTATSTLSPEVRAYTHSFAFAPAYTLDEQGDDYYLYLPLVLRNSN